MKVGIIGAGGISLRHLKSYLHNGARVTAVCDPLETKVVQEVTSTGGQWYKSYQEMFKKEQLDAVSICTTPDLHPEVSIAALERKINVLCEKPLANNLPEAQKMVEAAEKNEVILMTAFCYRFHPPVMKAREWIKQDKIGRILMFRQRFGGFDDMRGKWFLDREKGGGIINESMVHSIDLFHYLVGESINALAVSSNAGQGGGAEDMAIVSLKAKDEAIGVVEGSWSTPVSVNNIEIYGSKGAIFVDFGINFDVHKVTLYSGEETVEEAFPESGEPPQRFVRQISHFLDCVANKTKSLIITGADGLRAVQAVEWAYQGGN